MLKVSFIWNEYTDRKTPHADCNKRFDDFDKDELTANCEVCKFLQVGWECIGNYHPRAESSERKGLVSSVNTDRFPGELACGYSAFNNQNVGAAVNGEVYVERQFCGEGIPIPQANPGTGQSTPNQLPSPPSGQSSQTNTGSAQLNQSSNTGQTQQAPNPQPQATNQPSKSAWMIAGSCFVSTSSVLNDSYPRHYSVNIRAILPISRTRIDSQGFVRVRRDEFLSPDMRSIVVAETRDGRVVTQNIQSNIYCLPKPGLLSIIVIGLVVAYTCLSADIYKEHKDPYYLIIWIVMVVIYSPRILVFWDLLGPLHSRYRSKLMFKWLIGIFFINTLCIPPYDFIKNKYSRNAYDHPGHVNRLKTAALVIQLVINTLLMTADALLKNVCYDENNYYGNSDRPMEGVEAGRLLVPRGTHITEDIGMTENILIFHRKFKARNNLNLLLTTAALGGVVLLFIFNTKEDSLWGPMTSGVCVSLAMLVVLDSAWLCRGYTLGEDFDRNNPKITWHYSQIFGGLLAISATVVGGLSIFFRAS
jgi:hypothetical protein